MRALVARGEDVGEACEQQLLCLPSLGQRKILEEVHVPRRDVAADDAVSMPNPALERPNEIPNGVDDGGGDLDEQGRSAGLPHAVENGGHLLTRLQETQLKQVIKNRSDHTSLDSSQLNKR